MLKSSYRLSFPAGEVILLQTCLLSTVLKICFRRSHPTEVNNVISHPAEDFLLILENSRLSFPAGEVILLQSSSGEEVILLKCSKCNGLQQVNSRRLYSHSACLFLSRRSHPAAIFFGGRSYPAEVFKM